MFARFRWYEFPSLVRGAFRDRANARTEVRPVSHRIQFDAENRAHGEGRRGNTLLRDRSGPGHLDSPSDVLVFDNLAILILFLQRLSIWPDCNELDFGVI